MSAETKYQWHNKIRRHALARVIHRPVMVGQALVIEDIYQAVFNYPLNGHPWGSWYNLEMLAAAKRSEE